MSELEPKIYVACLASYNSGNLHGAWIDADQDKDDLMAEVQAMLKSGPIANAEEWGVHDYEDFGNVWLDQHESLETVAEIARFIVEHGKLGAAVLGYTGCDIAEGKKLLEECYHGVYDSEADFVREFLADVDPIPERLEFYIDYERMARDWFISDFFSLNVGRQVHVFSCY